MDYTTKDSGKREEFSSGMVRDTQDDKPRYDLIDLDMERKTRRALHILRAEDALLLWLAGVGHGEDILAHLAMIDGEPEAFFAGWAALMARGAKKYGEENWRQATGEAELKRFKASAKRHFYQARRGDTDEDHRAAVAFNVAGAEMVRQRIPPVPDAGCFTLGNGTCSGNNCMHTHISEDSGC